MEEYEEAPSLFILGQKRRETKDFAPSLGELENCYIKKIFLFSHVKPPG